MKIAKEILAARSITLDIKEFTDYVQPNNVVESGEIDANYFQHTPYLEDFNQMFCQIYEATGVKPQIFRFPGGSVNSYNVGIHQQLIAEMTRRGFVYFDWNVANGDAVFSKIQPSSTLTANALKGVGTARRAIILMHDSSAKTTTVEALPAIIEGYLEAGYSFAALTPSTRSVTFSYLD